MKKYRHKTKIVMTKKKHYIVKREKETEREGGLIKR